MRSAQPTIYEYKSGPTAKKIYRPEPSKKSFSPRPHHWESNQWFFFTRLWCMSFFTRDSYRAEELTHTHTHGFIIHEALTGVPYLWFYWRKFGPRRGGGSGSYGFLFDSLIGRLISFRKESAGAREPDVTFGISFTFFISRDGNNKNNAYIWPWTFFTMDKGISN